MFQIVSVIQALQYCIFITLIRPILGEPPACDVCYSKNFYIPTVAIFTVVSYGTWKTLVLIGAKGYNEFGKTSLGTAYPHSFWFSCTFVWFAALDIWVGLSLFQIYWEMFEQF